MPSSIFDTLNLAKEIHIVPANHTDSMTDQQLEVYINSVHNFCSKLMIDTSSALQAPSLLKELKQLYRLLNKYMAKQFNTEDMFMDVNFHVYPMQLIIKHGKLDHIRTIAISKVSVDTAILQAWWMMPYKDLATDFYYLWCGFIRFLIVEQKLLDWSIGNEYGWAQERVKSRVNDEVMQQERTELYMKSWRKHREEGTEKPQPQPTVKDIDPDAVVIESEENDEDEFVDSYLSEDAEEALYELSTYGKYGDATEVMKDIKSFYKKGGFKQWEQDVHMTEPTTDLQVAMKEMFIESIEYIKLLKTKGKFISYYQFIFETERFRHNDEPGIMLDTALGALWDYNDCIANVIDEANQATWENYGEEVIYQVNEIYPDKVVKSPPTFLKQHSDLIWKAKDIIFKMHEHKKISNESGDFYWKRVSDTFQCI